MNNNKFKVFEDKVFENFVEQKSLENKNEIFQIEYENKMYWVKKGRKTSSNLFHHLCYKLLSYEFLLPVVSKNEQESILFESNKLICFKKNALNVPEIIGSNQNYFVMTDCGNQVYNYLRKNNIKNDEFYYYLDKYILALTKIHNAGLFHGGAQSRNFTYYEGDVFAIDLEDSFEQNVDTKTLQFRDLLLLLLSMTKVDNFKFDYEYIIKKYIENTNNKDFIKKLKYISNRLSFLTRLNSITWLNNIFPRDVKGFCNLLEELKSL